MASAIIGQFFIDLRSIQCLWVSSLAFVGDVRSGMSSNIVFWPDSPFTPSGLVNVPSSEVLDGAFADNVDTEMLGPFQDDEAAVETLTVRPLMYLPPKFVHGVLAQPYMTDTKGMLDPHITAAAFIGRIGVGK